MSYWAIISQKIHIAEDPIYQSSWSKLIYRKLKQKKNQRCAYLMLAALFTRRARHICNSTPSIHYKSKPLGWSSNPKTCCIISTSSNLPQINKKEKVALQEFIYSFSTVWLSWIMDMLLQIKSANLFAQLLL